MSEQHDHERQLPEQFLERHTTELASAREAAESALAAKGAFLSRMSHEIRTPMNTIIGINHILLREVSDPRQKSQIGEVLGAANHLLALIDDILDLSRLEAGQVTVVASDFIVEQVLADVTGMVSTQATAKGLAIEAAVAAEVPRVLRGDASRLRQVLLNFATNAVKFTAAGHVRFSVNVTDRAADQVVLRFAVADTGIGLNAEQRNRLFQAFEQIDGGVSRRFGGTGLGLAICLRLAQLMGGKVGVESRPGHGSTFWIEAPFGIGADAKPGGPGGPVTARRVSQEASGRRILLVDDNTLNLEIGESLLRLEGFDVDLARDGVEAVERASSAAYAAILMDVQMPRMDGIQATRAIRCLADQAATPIIAMNANVLGEDRRQCLEAGMSDMVATPVDPAHLSAVLARWIPAVAGQLPTARSPQPPESAADSVSQAHAGTSAGRSLREQLLELQQLVAADDMSARDYCRGLSPSILGTRHAEIARRLEDFDYDQAAILIASRLHEC